MQRRLLQTAQARLLCSAATLQPAARSYQQRLHAITGSHLCWVLLKGKSELESVAPRVKLGSHPAEYLAAHSELDCQLRIAQCLGPRVLIRIVLSHQLDEHRVEESQRTPEGTPPA